MVKGKKPGPTILETEEEQSLQHLADAVTESLKEGCKSDLESFEVYAQKMRSHLHSDPQAFRARFLKGYQALLTELLNRANKNKPE